MHYGMQTFKGACHWEFGCNRLTPLLFDCVFQQRFHKYVCFDPTTAHRQHAREEHERGEPLRPAEGSDGETGCSQRHGPPTQPSRPALPRQVCHISLLGNFIPTRCCVNRKSRHLLANVGSFAQVTTPHWGALTIPALFLPVVLLLDLLCHPPPLPPPPPVALALPLHL